MKSIILAADFPDANKQQLIFLGNGGLVAIPRPRPSPFAFSIMMWRASCSVQQDRRLSHPHYSRLTENFHPGQLTDGLKNNRKGLILMEMICEKLSSPI